MPAEQAKAKPLTEEESNWVGRWVVDVGAAARMAKEQPDVLKLPADVSPEKLAEALLAKLERTTAIAFELREDRTLLFLNGASVGDGTWQLEDGRVVMDGTPALKSTVMRLDAGKPVFQVADGKTKPGPAKKLPLGATVTTEQLQGEWTLDAEASRKAEQEYWRDVLTILPAEFAENRKKEYTRSLRMREAYMFSLQFDQGNAKLGGAGQFKEMKLRLTGDAVILSHAVDALADGEKQPDRVYALFAEGDTLVMRTPGAIGVFVRKSEAPPVVKDEPPTGK